MGFNNEYYCKHHPSIKRVKNIDLLHELPFYDKLSAVKLSESFQRYTRNCKTKIMDSKDPLVPLKLIR